VDEVVVCDGLGKDFRVLKTGAGLRGIVQTLFSRDYQTVRAVDSVSFSVHRGEVLGYIGPNGAGKSTTIKMLTGILFPSRGWARLLGKTPHLARQENARRIAVVFGQRSQLLWDLPIRDSLNLVRHIYRVPRERYSRKLDALVSLLDLGRLMHVPVRQLSLGQKMRAELAASLVYDPEVVFLDEPTIGLDIMTKEKVRQFIQEMNRERQLTVFLTTHDLSDIERLCSRVIVIDKGTVVYDGDLCDLRERFGRERSLIVESAEPITLSLPGLSLVRDEGLSKKYIFDPQEIGIAQLLSGLLAHSAIRDVQVFDPTIDQVIKNLYSSGTAVGGDQTAVR
jgi:ABC-2 type transport system ATP-binding protein